MCFRDNVVYVRKETKRRTKASGGGEGSSGGKTARETMYIGLPSTSYPHACLRALCYGPFHGKTINMSSVSSPSYWNRVVELDFSLKYTTARAKLSFHRFSFTLRTLAVGRQPPGMEAVASRLPSSIVVDEDRYNTVLLASSGFRSLSTLFFFVEVSGSRFRKRRFSEKFQGREKLFDPRSERSGALSRSEFRCLTPFSSEYRVAKCILLGSSGTTSCDSRSRKHQSMYSSYPEWVIAARRLASLSLGSTT